jgi:hypothetical protein
MSSQQVIRFLLWPLSAALVLATVYLILCMLLPDGTPISWTPFKAQPLTTQMVGLVAGFGATIGWITSAHVSRINSIKQHTMSVLTQSRLSSEMGAHLRALYTEYPGTKIVLYAEVVAANQSADWLRGARYFLNFYEFLAVAMRHGDLYRPLLEDCLKGPFVSTFRKLEAVVKHAVDSDGSAAAHAHQQHWMTSPSRNYRDIRRLFDEWNTI